MNLSLEKKERFRWFHKAGLSVLLPVITFALAVASLIIGDENGIVAGRSIRRVAFWAALFAIGLQFFVAMLERVSKRKYLIMCQQEALSKATLLAQQKSNEAKTRNILQLT